MCVYEISKTKTEKKTEEKREMTTKMKTKQKKQEEKNVMDLMVSKEHTGNINANDFVRHKH